MTQEEIIEQVKAKLHHILSRDVDFSDFWNIGAVQEVLSFLESAKAEPPPAGEFEDKCETCEHWNDSSEEYCGSCEFGSHSNWKESSQNQEKRLHALLDAQAKEIERLKTDIQGLMKTIVDQDQNIDSLTDENKTQAEEIERLEKILMFIANAKGEKRTGHLTEEDCQRIAEQALQEGEKPCES